MNRALELVDYHYFFDIELSSVCNMHCNICPREKITRERGFMTMHDIALLNEWLPLKCNIMFSGMGEPLLFADIVGAISRLSNNERIIGITTNGKLLDKNMIDLLCDSKLGFLQVSVNHITPDIYYHISNEDNNEIIENIHYLITRKANHQLVQLSFIDDFLTENDKKEIVEFCDTANIKWLFKQMHNRGGHLNTQHVPSKKKNNLKCYLFSQFTFISSDGNVLSCCHDIQQRNILGNIYEHSFNQILQKKRTIIQNNHCFNECAVCNDVGRKNIVYYDR